MRVSFHRRHASSLPPRRRRSPRVFAIIIALTACTRAFAASRIANDAPAEDSAAVRAVDDAARATVDEHIRVHLKRLSRASAT